MTLDVVGMIEELGLYNFIIALTAMGIQTLNFALIILYSRTTQVSSLTYRWKKNFSLFFSNS